MISIDGKTKLYGVIGNPVKHSFSPGMHSSAFQEIGINAVYLPFLITEKQLPQLLGAFELTGVQGFNITIPFKEKIIPYLDALSDEAAALQSVNTVVRGDTGWKGYSTDGSGFVRSLAAAGVSVRDKRVVIVGAGGAARSIAFTLIKSGVSQLLVTNRTQSRADQLVSLLTGIFPDSDISSSDVVVSCDILVNATSVGMESSDSPVPEDMLDSCGMVVDIIYNPAQTTLLKQAADRSITVMNGLDMLLFQGVEAFEIWTGRQAPVEIMRQSLISSVYSEPSP